MKKKFMFIGLLGLMVAPVLAGCNEQVAPEVKKETNLIINETSKKLIYGGTFKIIASFRDGTYSEVSFYSVNDRVATVTSTGLVTAVGVGTSTIIVSSGKERVNCVVEVSYGDLLPTLVLENVSDDELRLSSGSSFTFNGEVIFDGSSYLPELQFSNYDEEVISFDGNVMTANAAGSTEFDVVASWNDFDCPSLKKHLTVSVVEPIELYARVTVGGKTSITNNINLSVIDKWPEGSRAKTYNNKAKIIVEATEDNVIRFGDFEIEDTSVVKKNGDYIEAVSAGSTRITIKYEDQYGGLHTNIINVSVSVPVADYYLDQYINLCTTKAFPVAEIFGDGAIILSASQNGIDLPIKRGKVIENIVPNGFETAPLTVVTNKGGYVFNKVVAYTAIVTSENFASLFTLERGKVIKGYYILDSDISVNMTGQTESECATADTSTYFAATIDGRGLDGTMHTINGVVGLQGLFGGFGDGAHLKNIHFNFTFQTESDGVTTKTSCGLARNRATYVKNAWVTTLENLYITTTNYGPNTYTLMILRFDHLIMHDIYVKINGSEEFEDFENVYTQKWAALFQKDATYVQGPMSQFLGGDLKNVHVVSNKFMPIANDATSEPYLYVTYAKNDYNYLGGIKHYSSTHSDSRYCTITFDEEKPNPKPGLFGHWRTSDNTFFERIAWVYENMGSDYADEGINRYNSISEIPVDKIGTWSVR